jgi:hypothetical protein
MFISYEYLQNNEIIHLKLPFIIEYENLFEFRELYESFESFVEKKNILRTIAFDLFF